MLFFFFEEFLIVIYDFIAHLYCTVAEAITSWVNRTQEKHTQNESK